MQAINHSFSFQSYCFLPISVPNEVLFGCGLEMGIKDFLGVYLRLIFVSTQLLTNERFPRFKARFVEFLTSFCTSNKSGWDEWLDTEVEGLASLGSVQNVLMSCSIAIAIDGS